MLWALIFLNWINRDRPPKQPSDFIGSKWHYRHVFWDGVIIYSSFALGFLILVVLVHLYDSDEPAEPASIWLFLSVMFGISFVCWLIAHFLLAFIEKHYTIKEYGEKFYYEQLERIREFKLKNKSAIKTIEIPKPNEAQVAENKRLIAEGEMLWKIQHEEFERLRKVEREKREKFWKT